MMRFAGALGAILLLIVTAQAASWAVTSRPAQASPPAPRPPAVAQVLQSGVLIVISKGSQQMFVFKDGAFWGSSPVSTGRPGYSTPAGVFPVLQKAVRHRSNLYGNAPMPYMQRLTWGGVAIHAGDLPGYPASHGCIRVPRAFAKALYSVTRIGSTTVVITNAAIGSETEARAAALATDTPAPAAPASPVTPPSAAPAAPPSPAPIATPAPRIEAQSLDLPAGPAQTIQLAAAASPAEARAQWNRLVTAHPELWQFRIMVVPAMVGSRRFYRLRASAPGAHAWCNAQKRAGESCFNVR